MPLPRKAILLLLDSLPLGDLGCYGGFREKTPGFDRLAASGAVFENACTPVVTDGGSAFEAQGPWSGAWQAFASDLRGRGGLLDEIVCTTLAALTETATSDRVASFLGSPDRGVLAISGPELVPPPVHGHLAVVDEAVAALHAAIDNADGVETLFIVGALQGAPMTGLGPAEEDRAESEEPGRADRNANGRADVLFPHLVAERVIVPLLVRTPAPVVPGIRIQALATTTDIIATLGGWLSSDDRPPLDAGRSGSTGFDLLPLIRCEQETIRKELLIRGPGEIALRTLDRYVVVRLDQVAANCDGVPRSELGDGDADCHSDASESVAVFRKPEDVWDRLDVGNTMPEERDMLVRRCRTLFAEIRD